MQNILKYSQLAKVLGVADGCITMALKHNRIVPYSSEEKTIDITDPLNEIWINKQVSKGKTFDMSMISASQKEVKEKRTERKLRKQEEKENEVEYIEIIKEEPRKKKESSADELRESLYELEIKKKKKELRKLDNDDRIAQIKIQKLEGELMPFDDVKSLYLFTIETIRSTYLQEVRSLADIFKQRFGGSDKEYVALQRDLTEKINDIIEDSKKNALKEVDNMRESYSEVRGRGEKI